MQRLGKLHPLIARLEELLAWLEMIPCPSFVDGVMLPKTICPMLCSCCSSRLRIKDMCKRMSFSWQCHVVELHMLASKVSVICFGVTNVYSSSDTSPCFFHALSGTCKLEIIHINDQHTIVLSMIEDNLPNIGENLLPALFTDSWVQMVFPYPSAIGVRARRVPRQAEP